MDRKTKGKEDSAHRVVRLVMALQESGRVPVRELSNRNLHSSCIVRGCKEQKRLWHGMAFNVQDPEICIEFCCCDAVASDTGDERNSRCMEQGDLYNVGVELGSTILARVQATCSAVDAPCIAT
jgi:hypothetical protein